MQIRLVARRGPLPRWQVLLAERLVGLGHAVVWSRTAPARPEPAALALLLQLEGLLYRRRGPNLTERIDPPPGAEESGPADLVIDLAGDGAGADALRLVADGSPEPEAIACAILDGREPHLAAVRGACVLAEARPALENRAMVTLSLDQVLERAIDLLAGAVAAPAGGAFAPAPPRPVSGASAARFLAAALAAKVLTRLLRRGETWNIGWRPRTDGIPTDPARWTQSPFTWLPWDPGRYLADPFVVEHEGRTVILCEELPFATGRGVISAVTLDAEGRPGPPRVVLERPYHLSYPFVFRHGGAIWMIPESSANRTVELYRASRFPDAWELEAVLIRDVCAGDATVELIDGTWWLFCTTTGPHGSSWDALSLFSAPDLRGPWRPHPGNPVLIDAAAARPAGALLRHESGLWRVAQDCRARYGAGLALCRIDRLDGEGFAQSVAARLSPGWGAVGCHTFNRSERFEVIDAVWPTRGGRVATAG